MHLKSETKEDKAEVEVLFDSCFAPGREALSSYRLREGVQPVADLCLVMRNDTNAVIGAIRYWPVLIGERHFISLLLGPIAIHPTHQGEGLGAMLIAESLDRGKRMGWKRVMLIGDEAYYRRFGFEKSEHISFPPPTNPNRILIKDLVKHGFKGVKGRVNRADYAGCQGPIPNLIISSS